MSYFLSFIHSGKGSPSWVSKKFIKKVDLAMEKLIEDTQDNYQIVKPNCKAKFIQLDCVLSYIREFENKLKKLVGDI